MAYEGVESVTKGGNKDDIGVAKNISRAHDESDGTDSNSWEVCSTAT